MNLKTFIITLFVLACGINRVSGQANMYLIQEDIRLPGIITDAQIDTMTLRYKQTTFQYYDGFSRPAQTVSMQATPLQKDLIQPVAYDNLGRQSKSYLPYTDGFIGGWYRSNATTAGAGQSAFYSTANPNNLIARDNSPFASQLFENSPLQRLLAAGTVGDGFQPGGAGTQHYKTVSYRSNTNATDGNILQWNFDGTYTTGTWYADNSLAVTDGTDEDNTETLTFTDLAGHIILKREIHAGGNLDTYYLYNMAGMVSYIIPPKATAALSASSYSLTTAPLNTLVFHFTYDDHGRVATKTVPGKGIMYMVYDKWSRPVLVQDANMRVSNKWNYIKYDVKSRAISQGIYIDATNTGQAAMQSYVNGQAVAYESRSGTLTNGGYYTNNAFPNSGITPLAYAYFDGYDLNLNGADDFVYITQGDANLPNEESVTRSPLKGVPTVVSKTTMGAGLTNTWLTKAVFYDKRGNTIQEQSNNQVYYTGANTITDVKTVVNDFTGVPQASKVVKKSAASTAVTVYTYMQYDHMYRLTAVNQKYNGGSLQQIGAYTYNEIGQVVEKALGKVGTGTFPAILNIPAGSYSGTHVEIANNTVNFGVPMTIPSGADFKAYISRGYLQSVDFRYNIRGQLLSINNSKLKDDGGVTNNDSDDLFGMQFLYDKTDANVANTASFNGKLTAVTWMSKNATGVKTYERSYKYGYDDRSRYIAANYAERMVASTGAFNSNTGGFDESGITFDENGNITHLNRNSSTQGTNPATQTEIDHLAYAYDSNNPNQLLKVTDGAGANYVSYGFRNLTGAPSTATYTYDGNGNLKADPYKGLALQYDDLNKTDKITVTTATNRFIRYTYNADGILLRKQSYDNNVLGTTTDYVDGFVYLSSGTGAAALSYFGMPEGRILNTGSALKPEYIVSDQQGNARISFQESTTPGMAVVTQENSYYPYGLVMQNSPVATPTNDNKHLYNGGSEWQNDYGNLPDYYQTFFRNYDAALGRFVGVDPQAEATESISSYHYAGNNPVMFNDPLGDALAYNTNPNSPGFNQQVGDGARDPGLTGGFTPSFGGAGESYADYFDKQTDQLKAFTARATGSREELSAQSVGLATNPYLLGTMSGATTIDLSQSGDQGNGITTRRSSIIVEGFKTTTIDFILNSNYGANQGGGNGPGPGQPQPTTSDNGSFWSHLVGPTLIALGQPINALKPIGMLGSRAGSSVASYTLRKIIPGTLKGTFGETIGGELVGLAGTNGLGAALGRFVPVLGVALTLGDIQSWGFHQTLNNAPNDRVREEMLTGYSLGL